jgi:hypothetical protein
LVPSRSRRWKRTIVILEEEEEKGKGKGKEYNKIKELGRICGNEKNAKNLKNLFALFFRLKLA